MTRMPENKAKADFFNTLRKNQFKLPVTTECGARFGIEDKSENRISIKFALVGDQRKKPDVSRMKNVPAEKQCNVSLGFH